MALAIAQFVAQRVAHAALHAGANAAQAAVVAAVSYVATAVTVQAATNAVLKAAAGTPDIETVKGSKKQAIPPRIRGHGRRKMGGYYTLWEAKGSNAYDVVYFCDGPIEAIEQIWSHDHVLTVDAGTGFVAGSPDYGGGAEQT